LDERRREFFSRKSIAHPSWGETAGSVGGWGEKSAAVTASVGVCRMRACALCGCVGARVCASAKHKTRVEYEANIHQLASAGNACNSAALTFHRGRPRFNKLTRLWILCTADDVCSGGGGGVLHIHDYYSYLYRAGSSIYTTLPPPPLP